MGEFRPISTVLGVLIFALAAVLPARGENPRSSPERQERRRIEFQQLIQELDSPCYETRRLAAARLERWLGVPEMAAMLAEQFQQLVVQPELPFEVRWRILNWQTRVPLAKSEPPKSVSAEELERLVCQLDDASYSVRAGAFERLRWMAASEYLAKPITLILKRRLTDPLLSEDTYRHVEAIRNIAWGIWLSSDVSAWNLPPVSPAQIDDWLNALEQPVSKRDMHAGIRRRIARQELLDLLSEDGEVPRVKAAIEAHLRGKLDQEAAASLRELLDMTRPALVAESWSGRKQLLEQHLIVGRPMQAPGAAHPSHFDRTDDHVAHCVSGNALTPGDYPVGVAFAAPNWQSPSQGFFHLVNLPTPRRQIAYSYYVKTDPAARLAKLSRRTLDRFLSEKKLLNDSELGILGQLDAHEVSRFAGRYFLLMEDGSVEEDFTQESSTSRSHLGSQSSRFGAICAQLALDGTRESAPGLLEAIRQKKFMSPTPLGPYRLQWLAALSIARRDPWPDVDAWLAENIDNQETVIIDHAEAPQIGATAAGLLLTRHDERPHAFGLRATPDSQLAELKLPGFRYAVPDDVQRVRQWWKRQSEILKAKTSIAVK
ncbi:MAG: hypothetical protein ABSG53_25455 [Thermoguttaceae bacterium]